MNWKQIKEDCPEAYKAHNDFEKQFWPDDINGVPFAVINKVYSVRNLYDFFDGQGIRVSIYAESEYVFIPKFSITLSSGGLRKMGLDVFPSRTEAETAAFTKAFELLEQKLTVIA